MTHGEKPAIDSVKCREPIPDHLGSVLPEARDFLRGDSRQDIHEVVASLPSNIAPAPGERRERSGGEIDHAADFPRVPLLPRHRAFADAVAVNSGIGHHDLAGDGKALGHKQSIGSER